MLNSLRNRLILSHLLPSLIIIPLMGVLLIFLVESRILLPTLTRELKGEAVLLAEILNNRPETWQDPEATASSLAQSAPGLEGRIMLLDGAGRILASSDPTDTDRIGTIPDVINRTPLQDMNEATTITEYNARLQGEVIDVLVPVVDSDQMQIGWVRITHPYETVSEQLFQFRFLLGAILLVALLAGAVVGYFLALNISTPIQHIAEAIYNLATGEQHERLPLTGPDEINLQVYAVNLLVSRLDSLEKARRQLLANLVHELGRPLGAIRSGLQALLRGAKDNQQLLDEFLVGMEEQADHLEVLLGDLAHLHDQVLGNLELNRETLDLSSWLPRILSPWQLAAQDKHQQLDLELPDDLPIIPADPSRLAQVVDNLVTNAIKYTPEGSHIKVSAGTREADVWIRISDDGPGMTDEEKQHVFEPFFRGDQKRRIKQGMGLGLSIARDLVLAHGGRLELESQPGSGSQFTIWLPRGVPVLTDLPSPSR